MEASWAVLEASWGVVGSSWVVLKGLGGVLGASGARFSWDSILDTILYPICNRFSLDLASFETCEKRSGIRKIIVLRLYVNFPTKRKNRRKSIVFGCSEAPFSRIGRLMGASRGWFWASWSVLEAS